MVSLASRQELWRGTNYCWSPGVYWSASGQYQSSSSVRCADKNKVQQDSRALGHRGGFDCEIVISQEPDADFEMEDLDVFDQIYHTMNESKVVLTISFVPLIMFALLILSEGFKKRILGLCDDGRPGLDPRVGDGVKLAVFLQLPHSVQSPSQRPTSALLVGFPQHLFTF